MIICCICHISPKYLSVFSRFHETVEADRETTAGHHDATSDQPQNPYYTRKRMFSTHNVFNLLYTQYNLIMSTNVVMECYVVLSDVMSRDR